MSFDITVKIPQFSGETDLTIRLTAPGSGARINGSADDPLTEDEDTGQFTATITEELSGEFEYIIFKDTAAIAIGTAEVAAIVNLNAPRFKEQVRSAVSGKWLNDDDENDVLNITIEDKD